MYFNGRKNLINRCINNLIDNALIIKDFDHNKIVFINGKVEELDFSFEDNGDIKQGGNYTTIPTKNVLTIKKIKI